MISPHSSWGGASFANITIAKMLVNCGNEVIYSDEYFPDAEYDGIEINHTPFHRQRSKLKCLFIQYVITSNIDVIMWSPAMALYYIKDILILKRKGVKHFSILHSLSLDRTIKGHVVDFLESIALSVLNGNVYVSNYTLRSWSKYIFIRNSKNIKKVIYNAIKMPEVRVPKECNTSKSKLGFVGRFSTEKQPEMFCQLSKFIGYELHAFGDGHLLNALKTKYPNVYFHGLIKNQEAIYSQIDVLIMTSKFENCPMVILEAMSRGIPCVVPNVGGIPEIVSDKEGVVYDVFDIDVIDKSVKIILNDYTNFSRRCIEKVEHYTYDATSKRWIDFINLLNK